MILIALGASGFVGLAVVLALFLLGGGSGSGAAAIREAGCTVSTYTASLAGNHVQTPPRRSTYNSFPPTSGPHHPDPAPFGVYDDPVEQYRLVHNLEHGGVVIQYGDEVPAEQVSRMVEWYRDDPNGIVIAPLAELGERIALAAWTAETTAQGEAQQAGRGVLASCAQFDEGAFDAFADAYGFKGPERFPRELLTPGA